MAVHTLSDGVTSVQLPSTLYWEDEFSWSPIVQALEYSFTGALIVQEGARLAGRPITLSSDPNRAWVQYALIAQIYTLASALDKQMTLTLADSRVFDVMFRHAEGALSHNQVMPGEDYYYLTIRLMQV